jgi:hypothetical protein
MPVVLRLLALLLGALALFQLYGIGLFATSIGLARLRLHPGLMALTIVCWAIVVIGGAIAAIQLWRLRRSGWWAALAVFSAGFLYYALGFLLFRGPGASPSTVAIHVGLNLLGVIVLASPTCRHAIQGPPDQRQ